MVFEVVVHLHLILHVVEGPDVLIPLVGILIDKVRRIEFAPSIVAAATAEGQGEEYDVPDGKYNVLEAISD